MKLICTQENLNKAISIVSRVIGKNTTLAILNNVLLKTEKNKLLVSSTNLELGVSCWVGGKIIEEGEVTVPTKLFSGFISNLPGGNVEIKSTEDAISLKCGGYKTNIKGLSAKEYPLSPKIEAEPIFVVDGLEFKRSLAQVLPSVSNSESRIEIMGVFMDMSYLKKEKIVLVATDSYRLAEKTINLKRGSVNKNALKILGDLSSVIIPKNTIQELIKDLDDENETVEVIISENQILFRFGSVSMVSRLIEGKYPDYKQIIPDKFESKASINVSEMINAIKVASLFANVSNNSVELGLGAEQKLEISSETSEIGSNNTKIPAEITGKDLKVRYNYKYLLDGLNSILGEKVLMEVNNENLPTILTSANDKSFIYVIMPIRN